MTLSTEQQIARKIVAVADSLQPKVSVVGSNLQFSHQGKTVKVPLFNSQVLRSNSALSK